MYHKRCRNQYNDLHYEKAIKRFKTAKFDENSPGPSKKKRSRLEAKNFQEVCFLCDDETKEPLSTVRTLQIDKRVRYSATRLPNEKSVAKLSEGDLVAKEARYHKNCSKRL